MRIGAVCLLSPRSFPMAIARDQYIPRAMRKTCHLCSSACLCQGYLDQWWIGCPAINRLLVPLLECTAYRVTVQCCRPLRFACAFIRHSVPLCRPPPTVLRLLFAWPMRRQANTPLASARLAAILALCVVVIAEVVAVVPSSGPGTRAAPRPSRRGGRPACDALLEVVQAVPVQTWTVPDESVYGVSYKGRLYTLARTRPPAGTTSKSADPPPCHPPGAAGPGLAPRRLRYNGISFGSPPRAAPKRGRLARWLERTDQHP